MKRYLLVFLPFLIFGCSTPDAKAGCASIGISAQTVITDETSEVTQSRTSSTSFSENCLGGSVTNVGTQTSVGTGDTIQRHNTDSHVEGGNPTSVRTRNVEVNVNPRTIIRVRDFPGDTK